MVSSAVAIMACASSLFGTPPRPSLLDWYGETDVMSCSRLDSLEIGLFAKGVFRAEQDYASGKAAIWNWESDFSMGPIAFVDHGTGLPLRPIGCVRDPFSSYVCATYNWHLRRIVNQRGLPPNAIGVKERYEKLCAMIKDRVPLQWVQHMAMPSRGNSMDVRIAHYELHIKGPEKSDRFSSAQVFRDGKLIGRCAPIFASVEGLVEVALIPELDVIVFNRRGMRLFFDAIHGRTWLVIHVREE